MLPPILVAAYGNELAGDDAFGPLVAEALRTMSPPDVEVVSLGMKPASLLDHLAGRSAVCVVDAARCEGLPAGALVEVDFFAPDRPPLVYDSALSSHGLAIAEELRLAKQLGICPPQVRLMAAIAESVEVGRPASQAVLGQVPIAAARIAAWAERVLAGTVPIFVAGGHKNGTVPFARSSGEGIPPE